MRGNTQRDQWTLSQGRRRVRSHSLCEWPSRSRGRYFLSICATLFPFKLRVNACVSNETRVPIYYVSLFRCWQRNGSFILHDQSDCAYRGYASDPSVLPQLSNYEKCDRESLELL